MTCPGCGSDWLNEIGCLSCGRPWQDDRERLEWERHTWRWLIGTARSDSVAFMAAREAASLSRQIERIDI